MIRKTQRFKLICKKFRCFPLDSVHRTPCCLHFRFPSSVSATFRITAGLYCAGVI